MGIASTEPSLNDLIQLGDVQAVRHQERFDVLHRHLDLDDEIVTTGHRRHHGHERVPETTPAIQEQWANSCATRTGVTEELGHGRCR